LPRLVHPRQARLHIPTPGGDADIIAEVKQGSFAMQVDTEGKDEDSESGDEVGSHDNERPTLTPQQGIELCRGMETLCLQHADIDGLNITTLQIQL